MFTAPPVIERDEKSRATLDATAFGCPRNFLDNRFVYTDLFFKLVLITNGTGLDLWPVQASLQYFTPEDEIWIKLAAGTQDHMDRVNRTEVRLEKVIANILLVTRQRPVVIQSLFPMVFGQEPLPQEIDEYILLLKDLKQSGAQISLVQIYSATRPIAHPNCRHMPLKKLSQISRRVKAETGLRAEVF